MTKELTLTQALKVKKIKTACYIPVETNYALMQYMTKVEGRMYGRNGVIIEALNLFLTSKGFPVTVPRSKTIDEFESGEGI